MRNYTAYSEAMYLVQSNFRVRSQRICVIPLTTTEWGVRRYDKFRAELLTIILVAAKIPQLVASFP